MQSTAFQLDDEHRSRIRDCLWTHGIQLNRAAIMNFADNITSSIVTFLKSKPDARGTYQRADDATTFKCGFIGLTRAFADASYRITPLLRTVGQACGSG